MKNKVKFSLVVTFILLCVALSGCEMSNAEASLKESTDTGTSSNADGTAAVNESSGPAENVVSETAEPQKEHSVNLDLRMLSGIRISIHAGEKEYIVDMYDNPTADDLISQLPLTLKVNDYAGWDEKIVRLRNPLSMEGAPEGDEPKIPEFGYYEPGHWLALYYGEIGYWTGKVPLGQINADVGELREIPDNLEITIDIVKD